MMFLYSSGLTVKSPIDQLAEKLARCLGGTLGFDADASGIIIDLTIGRLRWPRTRSSNTLSSADESDAPGWTIGTVCAAASVGADSEMPASRMLRRSSLVRMLLASPSS